MTPESPSTITIEFLESKGVRLFYQPGCGGCAYLWVKIGAEPPFTRDSGEPRQWWTLSRFLKAASHQQILREVYEEYLARQNPS